jgi:hypothetical protein
MVRFCRSTKASADVVGVGIAAQDSGTAADAGSRAVARFAVIRCAVNLDQHRIVNIGAERIFDSFRVHAMAVGR